MDQTPLAQLASYKLGEPVEEFIRKKRAERKTSLRDVADYLFEQTGIRVSGQTVLNWSRASDPAPADDRAAVEAS